MLRVWVALLSGGAVLAFNLGSGSPYTVRWTCMGLLAVTALLVFSVHIWRTRTVYIDRLTVSALCAFGYVFLSVAWSPDWREGLDQIIVIALLLVCFLAFRAGWFVCEYVQYYVIGAVVLWAIWPEISGGFGNENFITEFLLIATPAFCSFQRDKGLVMPAVALIGVVTVVAMSGSDSWMVVAGILPFLYCLRRRWWYAAAFWVVVPVNVLVLTDIPPSLYSSVTERLELWYNTSVAFLAAPWFGHGLGSFDYVYPLYAERHLEVFDFDRTVLDRITVFAGSAHNEFLQALFTFGVFGGGLIGWFVYEAVRRAKGWRLAMLGVAGALSLIAFPFQNPATAFLVVAALAAPNPARKTRLEARWCASLGLVAPCVATGAVVALALAYVGSLHFSNVVLLARVDPLGAFVEITKSYNVWPLDHHTRRQMPLTLSKLMHHHRVQISEAAADRIHAVGFTTGRHPMLLIIRAEYLLNAGRPGALELYRELQSSASLMPETDKLRAYLEIHT